MIVASRPPSETLSKRAIPAWYVWVSIMIPGVIALITCINRGPEFGLSVWVANLVVLLLCAAGVGCVTYWKSNFAATLSLVATIVLGNLAIAGLSHIGPVIVTTYGSLWTGSGLGLLLGYTLTAGERR